jgi:diguanylate cyclase (GGDEF)-like protein
MPGQPRYIFESIGDDVGLGTRAVTMIMQDSQGFIWVGTQDGLYRCDSSRTRSYSERDGLPDTWIHQIIEGPDGTIWITAGEEVVVFDGIGFARVVPLAGFRFSPQGTQLRQRLAVSADNRLYLAGAAGLVAYSPATGGIRVWSTAQGLPAGPVDAVHADDQDRIWFAVGNRIGSLQPEDGAVRLLALPEIREQIFAILVDGAGIVWARTQRHLVRHDPKAAGPVVECLPAAEAAPMGSPSLDRSGHLLLPSTLGLYYREDADGQWYEVSAAAGLRINGATYAFEDREGALWIGLYGAGVQRWIGRHSWAAWTAREGLPDDGVWGSLRDPAGRLWVGTSAGVGIWQPQQGVWKILDQADGVVGTRIWKLVLGPREWVWSLSRRVGITRYHPRTLEPVAVDLPGSDAAAADIPWDMARAPDGSVWVCTPSSLLVCGSSAARPSFTRLPLATGLEPVEVLSIASDGAVWVGGASGLGRYQDGSWQYFSESSGLRSNHVLNVIAISGSEVWIGYREARGVTHLRLGANGPQLHHYGSEQGLKGNRVWMLDRDRQGRIWVGGADGLSVIAGDGSVQVHDQGNGLIWNDIAQGGFWAESDGSILIGTSRGLAYFRPTNHQEPQPPPRVVITSVLLGSRQVRLEESPEVAYAQNSFSVAFAGLSFRNPSRVRYRYQLVGWDQEPIEARLAEVNYAALPAGTFQFEVWCCSAAGIWSEQPARFSFTVLPPWWQRWWARAGALVLLFAAVLALHKRRTRRLKRERRRLEVAVAERSLQLARANQELRELSHTDALTGARNRRFFHEMIEAEVAATLRRHDPPSPIPAPNQDLLFLLIDFDHFKSVNDLHGHLAGDSVLIETSRRLVRCLRKSDMLVRWGGEEFLVLCRNVDRSEASTVARRVLNLIGAEPFTLAGGKQIRQTCSAGWASLPGYLSDPAALSHIHALRIADKALYLAKKSGRNQAVGVELIEEAHTPGEMIDWLDTPLADLAGRVVRLVHISGPTEDEMAK